ncbi:unnamed protein product [Paramecium pentaurelia]|uniref:AP180 N-terminal homology (ANTH) domain-containing protein n=1 Tax=Paramecium pentaurelia TaxID=43138 RepID=A0A8S1URC7_9CILI|nr:unnamed protein product [Paramecium pentaurelia]
MINIFKSDFERHLYSSSILNNTVQLNVTDLKFLMKGFQEQQTPISIRTIFKKFINALPQKASYRVKLKILAACHVLLDDMMHGAIFAEYVNDWDGFIDNNNQNEDKFVDFYFQVLQRFANSISLIKMVKSQKSYTIKQFEEFQNMYYKAINLLNFVFCQTPLFKDILASNKEEIIYELLLLLWNDVIALYLFLEKLIKEFELEYSSLSTSVFFQIYQLLPDIQKIQNSIKEFYQLHYYHKVEKHIKEPYWKEINEKKLEEIHKYNQIVKISTTRHKLQQQVRRKHQTFTPQNNCQQQYFSNTTLGYLKRLSTSEDPFEISVQDNFGYQFTQQ